MVSEGYRHMMKVNRNIDYGHQFFYEKCSKANVGCVRSFKIFKELAGGFEDVGCKKNDFKNIARDYKSFAKGIDVQILLEKFGRMRSKNSGFFFEYSVDDSSRLNGLFWADSTSMQNYRIFGEAVSFDATYHTNKYSMIFTPFTGRDNQGKCVTFGAGLISREDQDSYGWVLSTFVKCMGSQPKMIITDQDLGLRVAIDKVLPHTRHRFCMWQIMMKVAEKLPHSLKEDPEFTKSFNSVVWSDTDDPLEFEKRWNDVMVEYDLAGHKWFEDMCDLHTYWIPAYFHDLSMSGLFRTTSLLESENSFFRRHLNKHANLSQLYVLFETAIETQRDEHDALSLVDKTRNPDLITKLRIEKHAALVYTRNIFLDVQKEIEAGAMFCTIQACIEVVSYDVDEDGLGIFKVFHNHTEDYISCSCKLFVRIGFVCRHMFAIFRKLKLNKIPDKYITRRWTKKASSIFNKVGQNQFALGSENAAVTSQGLFSMVLNCIGVADGNEELTNGLKEILSDFLEEHADLVGRSSGQKGKQKLIENYYGSSVPEAVNVNDPIFSSIKGSCSRLKSRKEAAIKRSNKAPRLCRNCNTIGYHDIRTCKKPGGKKNIPSVVRQINLG